MSIGNEPAYPAISTKRDDYAGRAIGIVTSNGGLTKRELFAAMAMQGLYAGKQFSASEREHAAHWSVEIADALLAQLSKDTP